MHVGFLRYVTTVLGEKKGSEKRSQVLVVFFKLQLQHYWKKRFFLAVVLAGYDHQTGTRDERAKQKMVYFFLFLSFLTHWMTEAHP